ncbi:hypothetical protein NMY22_g2308 [Coprinellus aureogranulatus]|nr:hypothetical protein NMY22_g2308 [Coprinellus aureogranulatus]
MPIHLGFTIWMEVEGSKLKEFKIEHDESRKTVTCWVPCQSGKVSFSFLPEIAGFSPGPPGKEFRIGLNPPDLPRQHHYALAFKMDGRRVELIRRKTISKDDLDLEPRYYEGQYEDGTGVLRPFQFAPLKHTGESVRHLRNDVNNRLWIDDDTYLESFKDGLGEIVVSIYTFEQLVRDRGHHADRSEAVKPLEGATVHERAKQRLASCIAFGQPRLSPGQSPLQEVDTRDPRKNKTYSGAERIGMVVFKYRDMDILIAEGIAPPRVTPQASSLAVQPPRVKALRRSKSRSTSREASSPSPVAPPVVKQENRDEGNPVESDEAESDDELRELKARAAALEELCNLKARIAELESKKRTRKEGSVPRGTKTNKKVKREHKSEHNFVPGEVIDLT